MSKQAMEMALEALTFYRSYVLHETDATFGKGDAAIVALKEAIKQQDEENENLGAFPTNYSMIGEQQ